MQKQQKINLLAPGVGSRILVWDNNASIPPYLVVENLDQSVSCAMEVQESDNGTSWSTIVGTSQSIPPAQVHGQQITSVKRKLALFAQGNVRIDVNLTRTYAGVQTSLD